MALALLVEDDSSALTALAALMERMGFSTVTARTWIEAKRELARQVLDVVLIDVFLPGGSGIDLLLEIPKERRPEVVMMSGEAAIGKALSALPMQELQFLRKPIEADELTNALRVARRRRGARPRVDGRPRSDGSTRILGRSAAIDRVRQLVLKIAPLELSVTIEGESGTGKELVARSIHEASGRRGGPFVALNCGALPENLIDSELFGHEKGAFTGADRAKPGLFEQASGGTLFLDEIAEMPLELQTRLLRCLENGSIRRVGGNGEIRIDVRVIAATNRRFDRAIADGRFREDLFHRLSVFPIVTPPLRERPEDIDDLVAHFLAEVGTQFGSSKPLEDRALDLLRAYDWPGNVRQLRNAIQRAFVVAEDTITADCLPEQIASAQDPVRPDRGSSDDMIELPVGTSIAEAERSLIEATLRQQLGDKQAAARQLGVSVRTLYNRLKEYECSTRDPTPG